MLGFPSPEAVQNHYESSQFENKIVADGRAFNCPVCKMKLPSEIELTAHFTRHHAIQKDTTEIEAMAMQVKVLEEAKALLQGKLQAITQQSAELSKENANIREERDSFKLKATKLTNNLEDLKQQYDELKAIKMSLVSAQKSNEDRIRKLEVEINQRPEADDVTVLQKELVSVQKMMNELTLQRENEKDTLQKQCNSVQEMCLKLQDEKIELLNSLKTYPSKEEIQSVKEVSTMTKTTSELQKELDKKESNKKKLQSDLEKYANYQEIKSMLSEKSNTLEEVQRLSDEKNALIPNAPDFIPQNKFENYSLSELPELCKQLKDEELRSFKEVIYKRIYTNESPLRPRDFYEIDVYSDLIENGSLTDKNLKMILERISSLLKNGFDKQNVPRYTDRYQSRSFDKNNHHKREQSYRR